MNDLFEQSRARDHLMKRLNELPAPNPRDSLTTAAFPLFQRVFGCGETEMTPALIREVQRWANAHRINQSWVRRSAFSSMADWQTSPNARPRLFYTQDAPDFAPDATIKIRVPELEWQPGFCSIGEARAEFMQRAAESFDQATAHLGRPSRRFDEECIELFVQHTVKQASSYSLAGSFPYVDPSNVRRSLRRAKALLGWERGQSKSF